MSAEIIDFESKEKAADGSVVSIEDMTCQVVGVPSTKIINGTIKILKKGIPVSKYMGEEYLHNTILFTGFYDRELGEGEDDDTDVTRLLTALLPLNDAEALRWFASEIEKCALDMDNGVYEDE